jgi:hypothetical protein
VEARIFTSKDKSGQDITLKFNRPTQQVLSAADLKYREAYSVAFRNGLLTNAEIVKYLRERGIWTDEQEKESYDLRISLRELELKLEDPTLSDEEGQAIVAQIKLGRDKLTEHNQQIRAIADNTCESTAMEARNQFLAATCVVNARSGVKVFKDMKDFLARLDEQVTLDSYREAVITNLEDQLNMALPSDLTSHYPENKWLAARREKQQAEEAAAEAEEAKEPEETEKPAPKKKSK